MDKHKALIEKACEAFTNSYHEHWEESDRWDTYNEHQKANTRIHITAALNAVYEALKEPSARLNSALCQFTNCARDDFEPVDDWNKETWANFEELCQAYSEAHEAGLFSLPSPLGKGE